MFRKLAMLIASVVFAVSVAGVQADSIEDRVDCAQLVEADCQLLRDNVEVMDGVSSLYFDMNLDLGVDLGGFMDLLQVNGAGGGKLAVDQAAADAALAAGGDASENTWIVVLASAIRGEISLHLTGELPEEEIDTQFIVLMENGVFVLNEGAMSTLGGLSLPGFDWIGYDARNAADELMAEVGDGGSTEDDGARSPEMEEANANAIMLTRLPDTEVMGIPVAVLETDLDFNSVISLMTLEDVLAEAESGEAQNAELVLALMQNTDVRDLSWRQYIGLDDHYTHRIDITMDITLAGDFLGMEGMEITITMSVVIDLSAYNEPVVVDLPEDVMLIPLELLLRAGL
jgi:hypothetical protein